MYVVIVLNTVDAESLVNCRESAVEKATQTEDCDCNGSSSDARKVVLYIFQDSS